MTVRANNVGNHAKDDGKLIFAALLQVLTMFSAARGVDVLELVEPLGVGADQLADRDARVPYETLIVVWEELMRRYPDAPLGLEYSEIIELENLGLIGLIIRHSPTLGAALERSSRMNALLDPMLKWELRQTGDVAEVRIDHEPRVVAMREPLEMMLATMYRSMAQAVTGPPDLLGVTLAHPQRHDLVLYEKVFGLQPKFDAEAYSLRFPSEGLERPLEQAAPLVAEYLERQLDAYLPTHDEPAGFAGEVAQVVDQKMSDGAEQAAVARSLAVSVRTLQRRLREEGTTFSDVLERARKRRAEELLGGDCAVYEVAYALGYSEPSTFFRWFKRAYGCTPAKWRD